MFKRILALLIAACLSASAIGIDVLAEETWVDADLVDAPVAMLSAEELPDGLDLVTDSEDSGEYDGDDLPELTVDDTLAMLAPQTTLVPLAEEELTDAETREGLNGEAETPVAEDALEREITDDSDGNVADALDAEAANAPDGDDTAGAPAEDAAPEPDTEEAPIETVEAEEAPKLEADGGAPGIAAAQAAESQTEAAVTVTTLSPGAVSLPYTTLRMGKGESVQLTPEVGEGVASVTYTSSKKKIAKVGADGVIRALKPGTAYVTLTTSANGKFKLKVVVKRAPTKITATPLNLGVGETHAIGYKTPAGTAGGVTFAGDAPSVFSVNERTGEVTGLTTGSGTVTLTTYNGKSTTCPVAVYNAPAKVEFDPAQTSVGKKKKLQLQMKFDEGAWSNIAYEVENPAVAKVSEDGVVTGVSVGQTVIRARTFVPDLYAETVFTVYGAPSKVWLDQKKLGVNVGQPFQLEPRIPAGSQTTFKYKSSKKKVATVSADGLVTPLKKGKTKITVTTHNKKKATLTLTVHDPGQLSSLKLKSKKVAPLTVGDVWQTEYVYTPETADPRLTWTSSNSAVATVDGQGVITALSFGYTTIKAVSASNKKMYIKFTLAVQTADLTLVIPDRTTDVAGIPANLAMIDAVKTSALGEIDRLKAAGELSADSAAKRTSMVENIFDNYAFPWMTPSKQKYWKASYSEGGRKDFKAGKVYYGMPYISGSGANRHYSAALALSEGRFTDSGQGYYLLNKGKYLKGKYVGNDCSGLINVSIWGTGSSHSADRTGDIYVSSAYRTISSYNSLLPGDLLCKSNSHVVMFLYYASADKSKIMIIENGGSEKGTNTVHCDVHTTSSYRKSGYRIRRLASL